MSSPTDSWQLFPPFLQVSPHCVVSFAEWRVCSLMRSTLSSALLSLPSMSCSWARGSVFSFSRWVCWYVCVGHIWDLLCCYKAEVFIEAITVKGCFVCIYLLRHEWFSAYTLLMLMYHSHWSTWSLSSPGWTHLPLGKPSPCALWETVSVCPVGNFLCVPCGKPQYSCGNPSQCAFGLGLSLFCSRTVLCHHWEHWLAYHSFSLCGCLAWSLGKFWHLWAQTH